VDADAPAVRPRTIVLAPDEPVSTAVQAAIALGLETLKQMLATATSGEAEPLHQLRVAARRLRAAVELFAGILHGARVRTYRRDLQWLGRTAGLARECDVTGDLVRARSAKLDPLVADALGPVYEALTEQRGREHQAFLAAAKSKRWALVTARLSRPIVKRIEPTVTVRGRAAIMLRPMVRSVMRAGSRLADDSPPELFHRLRVRVKRLRYALEMVEPLGGKRYNKARARLAKFQDLLGLHQDAVAAITWLRSYSDSTPAPPATLLAIGALIQSLIERQYKLAARSFKEWKRLARRGVIRKAIAELGRHARAAPKPEAEVDNAA
jgi:CHAD domain-containing protein